MSKEEEGVGEKGESLSLYKGGRSYAPPHLPGKLAYSPSVVIDGVVCWKYALEAIIKWLLLYFLVHDNCLLFML